MPDDLVTAINALNRLKSKSQSTAVSLEEKRIGRVYIVKGNAPWAPLWKPTM